jgi:hypothetical protein
LAAPPATVELLPTPSNAARASADAGSSVLDDLEKLAGAAWDASEGSGVGVLAGIVFLRLVEERGLERFGELADLANGKGIGPRLVARLCEAADRYGVRGLRVGANSPSHDRRTPLARASDGPLRDLLLRLYSPTDPGEIARMPPDALGQLYERSLGIGEPRSTRKRQGAFYTPSYLVDYVVARTLGRVLEATSPDEVPRVRVLDPACGSGAFLLGAFRHLLAWHEARAGRADEGRQEMRQSILENVIFGVDVDGAAVDVAKLSLLLACFDHTPEGPPTTLPPTVRAALPRLHQNLRAGHSLIDTDWQKTVSQDAQPFHWQRGFPDVFAQGGFDVVMGNPPYLSFGGRHAVGISAELRRYYAAHYESGGWPTAHSLFLERSVKLLSRRFVSFVVPDQVGHLGGYRSAREIAQREAGLVEVRYWGERVFRGVTTPALTIVLDKESKGVATELIDRDGLSRRAIFRPGEPWSVSPASALIARLRRRSFSLGKLVGDCGIRTTAAKEQVVDWPTSEGNAVPVLEGKLVDRYGCRPPRVAVRLDSAHPLFVSGPERYRAVSFVIRQTASYPIVGPREHALYFRNSLLALFPPSGGVDVLYLVALLNSKLLRFVYTETVREAQQRTFPQVKIKALQSLPLRKLDLAHAGEKRRHDALVELVGDALAARKTGICARETEKISSSSLRFQAIDEKIDHLVYELYELSTDEREAVEQSIARASAPG